MIDTQTKKAVLSQILASQEFTGSVNYTKLLKYLVDASINGRTPKEFSIGSDVFEKDAHFNPNDDPIVRVYIHNLRNKLKHYYQNQGRHDKIILQIPKGHYEVKFVTRLGKWKKNRRLVSNLTLFILLIFSILGFTASFYFFFQNKHLNKMMAPEVKISEQSGVWADFFQNSDPYLLVLGDHFFYQEYQEDIKSWVIVRQPNINSREQLDKFKSQHPLKEIQGPLDHPYFALNSVAPLSDLLPLFEKFNKKFLLKYSSILTPGDLKRNNILFVGSNKTLGIFEQILTKLNQTKSSTDLSKYLNLADSSSVLAAGSDANKYHRDFCQFAKIPGPTQKEIMIIASSHATGTCGVCQYLSNPLRIAEFDNLLKEKYQSIPKYFVVLFEVRGYQRINFKTIVREFYRIDNNLVIW